MTELNAETILAILNANKPYIIGAGVGLCLGILIMKARGKKNGK